MFVPIHGSTTDTYIVSMLLHSWERRWYFLTFNKPMMSAILVSHVKLLYLPDHVDNGTQNNSDDKDCEPISLHISVDYYGNLETTNQFHDYYHWGDTSENHSNVLD